MVKQRSMYGKDDLYVTDRSSPKVTRVVDVQKWRTNQDDIRHLPGALPMQKLSIQDGAISPSAAFVVVDTEGGAPADDLTTIDPGDLHDGMEIGLVSADSSRTVTVKTSASSSGIRTINGEDAVLKTEGTLRIKLISTESIIYWQEISAVKISDSVDSMDSTTAASSKAVKTAYDRAKQGGTFSGPISAPISITIQPSESEGGRLILEPRDDPSKKIYIQNHWNARDGVLEFFEGSTNNILQMDFLSKQILGSYWRFTGASDNLRDSAGLFVSLQENEYNNIAPDFFIGVNNAIGRDKMYYCSKDTLENYLKQKFVLQTSMQITTNFGVAANNVLTITPGGAWVVMFIAYTSGEFTIHDGGQYCGVVPGGTTITEYNTYVRRGYGFRIL